MSQSTNQTSVHPRKPGQPKPNRVILDYDFARDGGALGDIALTGDTVPTGAYITDAQILTVTPLTSGGAATVAVTVEGAADVNAADVLGGAPWSAAGVYLGDKFGAPDAGVLTTADRTPKITIGVAGLTAGKFYLLLTYYILGAEKD